jgi:hypothetical protein
MDEGFITGGVATLFANTVSPRDQVSGLDEASHDLGQWEGLKNSSTFLPDDHIPFANYCWTPSMSKDELMREESFTGVESFGISIVMIPSRCTTKGSTFFLPGPTKRGHQDRPG